MGGKGSPVLFIIIEFDKEGRGGKKIIQKRGKV